MSAVTVGLILRAQQGDQRADDEICRQLAGTLEAFAYRFRYPGGEHDDIVQWGWRGVLGGIRSYKPIGSRDPEEFLLSCAWRQMGSGLRHHRKLAAAVLNDALRIEATVRDTDGVALVEALESRYAPDPVDAVIASEELAAMVGLVNGGLTPTERRAFVRHLNGATLRENAIAETGVDPGDGRCKRVENALDRTFRKLRHLQEARAA